MGVVGDPFDKGDIVRAVRFRELTSFSNVGDIDYTRHADALQPAT